MASPLPSVASKAVAISNEPETVIPIEHPEDPLRKPHLHRAISSKRLHGRLPVSPHLAESVVTKDVVPDVSLAQSQAHRGGGPQDRPETNENALPAKSMLLEDRPAPPQSSHASSVSANPAPSFVDHVKDWLENERRNRNTRHERRRARRTAKSKNRSQTSSSGSEDEALDALETLIEAAEKEVKRPPYGPNRRSSQLSRKGMKSRSLIPPHGAGSMSDTDYTSDGEPLVPSCEETLGTPEAIGMEQFKKEILTLAHTLRCKGWRRISLDRFNEISAERISGALTNAVYMISPPAELPTPTASNTSVNEITKVPRTPSKLLLRIYGPQVSHLIDRETELQVLRRLARQRIGPRLLGTFENGRFEEFFASHTLTRDDIRVPETSRHIAKRLKELHEGIDLEEAERLAGPIVFKNWEKWVPRARGVMEIVDEKSLQRFGHTGIADPKDTTALDWEKRGLVCGTKWDVFEKMVQRYQKWLYTRHGGPQELQKELVFAHNDTQYGNILRLHATGKSPLLLPMNEHRQLIVIDFEYASANHRGFEFANHFCEWMANYHDASCPYYMRTESFPTHEQQRNFLRAYLDHSLAGFGVSPRMPAQQRSSSSLPAFTLDARTPAASYREEEEARASQLELQIEKLRDEARAWRAASHLMWCAWGIVQATLEYEDHRAIEAVAAVAKTTDDLSNDAKALAADMADKRPTPEEGEEEEEEEAFDYLGYAQQRALLFWGDMLELGIVCENEIPELVGRAKRVGR